MDVDVVLLPLCVGLALIGVIVTGLAWRRGNKGRVVQGVGLAMAPVALYFSGILRLLWDGAVAIVDWASKIIFSIGVWFGLSLLALCVLLWIIGGLIAKRLGEPKGKAAVTAGGSSAQAKNPAVSAGTAKAGTTKAGKAEKGKPAPPVDEDMAEIEALLKSRGIE